MCCRRIVAHLMEVQSLGMVVWWMRLGFDMGNRLDERLSFSYGERTINTIMCHCTVHRVFIIEYSLQSISMPLLGNTYGMILPIPVIYWLRSCV